MGYLFMWGCVNERLVVLGASGLVLTGVSRRVMAQFAL